MSYPPPERSQAVTSHQLYDQNTRRSSNEPVFVEEDDDDDGEPRSFPLQSSGPQLRHHRRQSQNVPSAYRYTGTPQTPTHPMQSTSYVGQTHASTDTVPLQHAVSYAQPSNPVPSAAPGSPALSTHSSALATSPLGRRDGTLDTTSDLFGGLSLHNQSADISSGSNYRQYRPLPSVPEVQGQEPPVFNVTTQTVVRDGVEIEHRYNNTNGIQTIIMTQPREQITDPFFLHYNVHMQGLVLPSTGGPQVLFPSFQVRSSDFYVVGRVLTLLWSEPAGTNSTVTNIISEDRDSNARAGFSVGQYGERVFSKVRRFVVIRQNSLFCTALPIVSYGYRGVSKHGVTKSDHAIIYIGREAPLPLESELPQRGEMPMRQNPIRVVPDTPQTRLHVMSRIDFGKPHTIHHNLKVASVGMVHHESVVHLITQFQNVWNFTPINTSINTATMREYRAPNDNQPVMSSQLNQRAVPNNSVNQIAFRHHLPSAQQYPQSSLPYIGQTTPQLNPQQIPHIMQAFCQQGYTRDQAFELIVQRLISTQGYTREQANMLIMNHSPYRLL